MKSRREEEQRFWDSCARKYDTFIEKHLAKAYEEVFAELIEDTKETENLLETGTGTGIIAFRLYEHIPKIMATDLSPEMIKIAEEKAMRLSVRNIDFRVEDLCDLGFPDHSFDTVIASNVLHLLFDPETALREMKRVVKDNGQIIIPTYCHGQSLLSHIVSRIMGIAGFRARSRWSVADFNAFITDNGLRPVKTKVIKGVIPLVYMVVEV
jgi:ubiquinone/menaquinone biosynthesis C-methylase UbiE